MIVVIAILAAISIVAYNGVTQKARDDERSTNARNLLNAAASFQSDNDQWPTVAQLGTYNVIRLDGGLVSATDATDPTAGNKNHYSYVFCNGATTTTNQNDATGVRVSFWRDENSAGVQRITTGTCS